MNVSKWAQLEPQELASDIVDLYQPERKAYVETLCITKPNMHALTDRPTDSPRCDGKILI